MTVPAGSEENVTPEDKWIYKFNNWDLDADMPSPSFSAPPPATDETEAVVESEEEASDEDGDDDDEYQEEE